MTDHFENQVRRCAEAVQAKALRIARHDERTITDQTRAEERCGLEIGELVWHRVCVVFRHGHELGVTAVGAMPDVVDIGEAVTIGVVNTEIDNHALADASRVDIAADGDDIANWSTEERA